MRSVSESIRYRRMKPGAPYAIGLNQDDLGAARDDVRLTIAGIREERSLLEATRSPAARAHLFTTCVDASQPLHESGQARRTFTDSLYDAHAAIGRLMTTSRPSATL